jgi:ATP-dependent DNA helicase RecG
MNCRTTLPKFRLLVKLSTLKQSNLSKPKTIGGDFVDDTGQMELVWFQGHKWIREFKAE